MELFYIQQIIAGDTAKFSYFIDRYKDMAFSITSRIINNRQDAEEIVQDAFLKAYSSLKKFRAESRFSTWFYRIVVNMALNKARKKIVPTSDMDAGDLPDSIAEQVEETYLHLTPEERTTYINAGLGKLKMEDALVLTLYYLEEHSIGEIATITSISPENVKMQLYRARQRMYKALTEIFSPEIKNLLP